MINIAIQYTKKRGWHPARWSFLTALITTSYSLSVSRDTVTSTPFSIWLRMTIQNNWSDSTRCYNLSRPILLVRTCYVGVCSAHSYLLSDNGEARNITSVYSMDGSPRKESTIRVLSQVWRIAFIRTVPTDFTRPDCVMDDGTKDSWELHCV